MATEIPFTASLDFRHHKTPYEKGQEYSATEGLVTYFVMNGWATSPYVDASGEPTAPADVTLEVADIVQDQSSETGS
jgi:hypothetical protein